ncbi:MAG TPA: lmo0937 family membrane protein [Candidatus Limnocylindrales bacterium]
MDQVPGRPRQASPSLGPLVAGALDGWAQERDANVLWTILVILVVLWLLGFAAHIAGAFIHLLLVLAVIVLIAQLLSGRRTV